MKIYVATKFEAKEVCRMVQRKLLDAGHTITHDWTKEDVSTVPPYRLNAYLAECAVADYQGVLDSDLVVFLARSDCKAAFTEIGMAIAWGRPVYVVSLEASMPNNIFFHLPPSFGVRVFSTIEELLGAVNEAEFWDMDNA